MPTRKETPDVLGEILAGSGPAPEPSPLPPAPVQPPRPARTRRPASPKPAPEPLAVAAPAAPPASTQWEYLVVSLQEYNGWHPRYINGREVKNWMDAPVLHDYLDQLGEDGWELAAAAAGRAMFSHNDAYQIFLKRPVRRSS